MRVATNILAEDPQQPMGAHRFWTPAGAAAVLVDPTDPAALAKAVAEAAAPGRDQLRDVGSSGLLSSPRKGPPRPTPDVYREAAERKEN